MITWRTQNPVVLACGPVEAGGTAWPQVRSPERLAALGDEDAQQAHVRAMILEALAQVLQGMQPTAPQLAEFTEEIASATLVAANDRLRPAGVSLLDLNIGYLAAIDARAS